MFDDRQYRVGPDAIFHGHIPLIAIVRRKHQTTIILCVIRDYKLQMSANAQNVPAVFDARKNKILEELSLPEYTDRSPKGSVDEGIRDLIRDIKALLGLVTTGSCGGYISVFL